MEGLNSQRSAVAQILLINPTRLGRTRSFAVPLVAAIAFVLAIYVVAQSGERTEFTTLLYVSFAIMTALVVMAAFLFVENQKLREINHISAILRAAMFELEFNSQKLSEYLDDLDRRTTRYFNCVTNSKVKTYFILRYFDGSLKILLKALQERLDNPNGERVLEALYLLKGNMPENTAMTGLSNSDVPVLRVHELPGHLMQLIETLEEALVLISKEIDEINNRGRSARSNNDEQDGESSL